MEPLASSHLKQNPWPHGLDITDFLLPTGMFGLNSSAAVLQQTQGIPNLAEPVDEVQKAAGIVIAVAGHSTRNYVGVPHFFSIFPSVLPFSTVGDHFWKFYQCDYCQENELDRYMAILMCIN